jgi:hypothetical protein
MIEVLVNEEVEEEKNDTNKKKRSRCPAGARSETLSR